MRLLLFAILLFSATLLSEAGAKRKGPKRNRGRSDGTKMKKTRSWFQADSEENCTSPLPEVINSVEKPVSLCDEMNTTVCICSTRDDITSDSAKWKFKCGECKFKWSIITEEEEDEDTEANDEGEEESDEDEEKQTPKSRKNKRQKIRNKMKQKKNKHSNQNKKRRNKN